jgi:type VI secretion system protein ImpJ
MARTNLERVVWSEGMLMCPQHLQQQDIFFEAMLGARLGAITANDWGITDLVIDEGELSSGTFKLTEFRGVLPSGLPLDFRPGDGSAPAARPVGDHFTSTAAILEVYIAVPSAREGIPNYQEALDSNGAARYRIMNRPVPDLTIAKTEQIIGFGRPNAQLRFGNEAREDFDSIKIAEVVRDATGQFGLSSTYIPPALKVTAAPVLQRALQDLLSTMLAKHRALAEVRRQVDAAAVEFDPSDTTRFLQLNAIATYIPAVRFIGEYRNVSPLHTYERLIELGGALTTFSGDVDPSGFPNFNHNDLRSTFEPLIAVINKMLGATIKERCIIVPLEARKDGMWIGQLKDDRLPKCHTFVLAVEAQSDQQETANRLPKLSKIASWKQINQIVRSATPGVPLNPTHRPPPEIPVRPKQVYFLLGMTDAYWRAIATERTVAIYLPPPFDPSKAEITLMGIPERLTRS